MKKKIFEIARELGITSKELIQNLKKHGIDVKSHMSLVDEKTIESFLEKATSVEKIEQTIKVPETTTISYISEKLGIQAADIIKGFMEKGRLITINQSLSNDDIVFISSKFNCKIETLSLFDEELIYEEKSVPSDLKPRSPVVTIMGHVDHGKTTLLDAIRETNIVQKETGGITQHIGAYSVSLPKGRVIFLDTPGHEAFTKLRARGASITDIIILVVAADDGVMPQTVEAIDHAKAAKVPIVVAVNKIDKPDANSEKVRNELSKYDLISEEWGGKTIFVDVSAKKKIGLEKLLEMLLLEAELLELKANPNLLGKGTIIEAELDKSRGPVATVLILNGTVNLGDSFVAGLTYGKVRAMIDSTGKRITSAGPPTPVQILGFTEVTMPGEKLIVVKDAKTAREIVQKRKEIQKTKAIKPVHITLEQLYTEIQQGEIKELHIIIKGDVQGSVEALKSSLENLSNEKIRVSVIHAGVGNVNESDVMLASASNAIIIGFHVEIDQKAEQVATEEAVETKFYNVIYEAISDVKSAMQGMLEPKTKEVITGSAEIRQVFNVSKGVSILGTMVKEGKIVRGNDIKIIRDGQIIFDGKISTLKRFREDVKEVTLGFECGVGIENFTDAKIGDLIQAYTIEKIRAS